MKRFARSGRLAAFAASVSLTVPPQLLRAAEPAPTSVIAESVAAAFRITDVALDERGALAGQAVNLQGQPMSSTTVVLDDGRRQTSTTTDAQGQFRFEGLRGGAYRVQAGKQMKMCRAWKAGTAPPAANRGLMIVEGDQTALGQYCGTPVGGMTRVRETLRNPLVIGGLIAAAIAIPVALHNSDDDPAS